MLGLILLEKDLFSCKGWFHSWGVMTYNIFIFEYIICLLLSGVFDNSPELVSTNMNVYKVWVLLISIGV